MKRFIFTDERWPAVSTSSTCSRRSRCCRRRTISSRNLAERDGTVLFVGTKKQAQDAVPRARPRVGMPYVNSRWLGGLLTNWRTIADRIAYLHDLRRLQERRSARRCFRPRSASRC